MKQKIESVYKYFLKPPTSFPRYFRIPGLLFDTDERKWIRKILLMHISYVLTGTVEHY